MATVPPVTADDERPADLPIPPTGWERVDVDPDTGRDAWAWDSLQAAVSPAPRFVYEAATEGRRRRSPIRLHPAEYARMVRASWATRLDVGDPVLGVEVVVDADVPEGSIRLDAAPERWLA